MIILKQDIPSDYGLEGKQGEVKEFSPTIEAQLIQREIAEAYVKKTKKEKEQPE